MPCFHRLLLSLAANLPGPQASVLLLFQKKMCRSAAHRQLKVCSAPEHADGTPAGVAVNCTVDGRLRHRRPFGESPCGAFVRTHDPPQAGITACPWQVVNKCALNREFGSARLFGRPHIPLDTLLRQAVKIVPQLVEAHIVRLRHRTFQDRAFLNKPSRPRATLLLAIPRLRFLQTVPRLQKRLLRGFSIHVPILSGSKKPAVGIGFGDKRHRRKTLPRRWCWCRCGLVWLLPRLASLSEKIPVNRVCARFRCLR